MGELTHWFETEGNLGAIEKADRLGRAVATKIQTTIDTRKPEK